MTTKGLKTMKRPLLILALIVAVLNLPSAKAQSQGGASAPAKDSSQMTFSTPQAGVVALVNAASNFDVPALTEILGPAGQDLISAVDPVRDKSNALAFAERARAKNRIQIDSKTGRAILLIGEDEFPFAIPLVKTGEKWRFDTQAGRFEILYRRIGENELDAIQVCHGYVEAQLDYASTIHDDSGINQYAQKILSSPGKQDGLYWQNTDGTSGGPISETVAKALAEGYTLATPTAYHGYYFKILKGQGAAAPMGGKINYLIQGAMIGGFALVAVPADYRVTGVKTFMVGPNGVVYQKDLGHDSLNAFKEMELFNPDKTWQPTYDQWPSPLDDQVATSDK
jgi:Protein of unknown function (DUF2950)